MKPNAKLLLKRLARQIDCAEDELEFLVRETPDQTPSKKLAIPDPDKRD